MREHVWTLSNALSVARVLLVIPIAVLLAGGDAGARAYAIGLMVIAAVTDLFDGLLARKLNQVTEFGKVVDPLADKISAGAVALILALQGKLPGWYLGAVLGRDLLIFLGGLHVTRTRGVILQSNRLGKWTVAAVAAYLLLAVIDWDRALWLKDLVLGISTSMLILSFAVYLRRYVLSLRSFPRRRAGEQAIGVGAPR